MGYSINNSRVLAVFACKRTLFHIGNEIRGIFLPFQTKNFIHFAGSSCTSFGSMFSWRVRHSSRTRRITVEMIFGRGSRKILWARIAQILSSCKKSSSCEYGKSKLGWARRIPWQTSMKNIYLNQFQIESQFWQNRKNTKFSLKNHFFLKKTIWFQGVILKNLYFLRVFFCKILLWKRLRRGCEIVYVVHKTWKMM